jgi:CSLREA domain-containing protein
MKIGPGFKASMKRRSVRIALALATLSCIASFAVARRIAAFQTPTGVTYTVYRFDFDGHDINPGDGICEARYQTGQYVCGFIPFGVAYCPTFESGCTLRAAVEEANAHPGADTINFASEYGYASGLGCRTMFAACTVAVNDDIRDVNGQWGTGNIPITDALTINGLGAQRLIFDGGGSQRSRIFSIGSVPVTITGITLQGGNGSGGYGGAIYASGGALTLDAVHVTGNSTTYATDGGGIYYLGGTHQIRNSTFFNNTTLQSGGALALANNVPINGQLTISNSTFSGNTAALSGGGLHNWASMTLRNSTITANTGGGTNAVGGGVDNKGNLDIGSTIIAGNSAPNYPEIRFDSSSGGTVTSAGYNLIGDSFGDAIYAGSDITYQPTDILDTNPKLGALQNNGGPTLTRALAEDSPAYDKGKGFGLVADQRGFLRTIDNSLITNPLLGDGTDIGAYEIGGLVVNSLGDEADAAPGNGVCEIATGNRVCTLRAAIEELNASPLGSYKIFFALPGTGMRTVELFTALPAISRSVTITGLSAGLLTVKRSSDPATPPFRIFKFQNRNGAEPTYATVSGLTISNGLATLEGSAAAATGGGISNNATELTLDGVHVTGNRGISNGGSGAGIFNSSTLTIRNSTISNNVGQKLDPSSPYTFDGGGIYSITDDSCGCKTFTMINSTVSSNSVDGGAGGIFTFGPATVTNSTIAFNSAGSGAGGIVNQSSSSGSQRVTLGNTIVSDNRYNGGSVGDIYSTRDVISQGYNLVQYPVSPTLGQCGGSGPSNWCGTDLLGIDPKLLPLGDYGGPTPTHSFPQSSPAVDKGNSFGQTADQRGVQRPLDFPSITNSTNSDGSDMGAYESGGEPFVFSMNRMDVNPNGINTTVRFNVTFSEDVTEVNSNDFTLTTTGAISGATITGVTGSGTNWTVSINTGTAPGGTIRLDFVPHGTVIDADKNPITNPFAGVFYDIQPEFDVTAPGDPVRLVNGTSDDSVSPPLAGKGPDKAIDDTTTPYYNDYDNGSGLIVAPARGATIVTALRIYPGLQSKDSDPASYKLEGSNDGGVTFTTISEGTLALPDQRNPEGKKLDAPNLVSQTVTFSNSNVFTSYRLTFPTLKGSQNAYYMVVGEVEFIGSDAVAADLALSLTGGNAASVNNPGGNISYQITLTNNGPDAAANVTLSDAIPANTTFDSFTQNSGPTFTAATPAVGGTGNISTTTATLAGGESAVFTLVVRVNDSVTNNTVITNTASATTSTTELNSSNSSVTTYALITCSIITLSPTTLPAGDTSTAYGQTISASGGLGNYTFSLSSGSLPDGLTLAINGVISGSPTKTGAFNFTVKAMDGANGCPGMRSYSIQIECGTITIPAATLPNGTTSAAYPNQTITASGGTASYTYSVSTGSLPNGLSLSSTGIISGTPTAAGTYSFAVKAADANGCSATQSYTIAINCAAITISPSLLPDGTLNLVYLQTQVSASGGTGSYGFAITGLPNGLSFTQTTSSATIEGTPTQSGTFTVTVAATDGNNCPVSKNYALTIGCAVSPLVTSTSDDGAGSLRRAIATQCEGSSNPVTFNIPTDGSDSGYDSATGVFTIKLSTAEDGTYGPSAIAIRRAFTFDAGNQKITITRDSSVNMRLFYVASSGNLKLKNLTLTNGYARGGDGGNAPYGGGGGGAAGLGGAIYNAGSVTLYGSTLSGNQSIGGDGSLNNVPGKLGGGGGGGLGGNGNSPGPDVYNGGNGGGPNGGSGGISSGGRPSIGGGSGGIGGGGGGGGANANGGSSTFGGGGGGGGFSQGPSQMAGGFGGFGGGNGGTGSNDGHFSGQRGHGGSGYGGAIFNDTAGIVTVVNSTLTGNNAQGGTGATSGKGQGGAIFNRGGTVKATSTTIAANTADQGGGGIYNLGDGTASATLALANSIVAGTANGATDIQKNTANGGTSTVGGSFNLIGKTDPATGFIDGTNNNQVGTATALDPKLDMLKYNGGVTQTLALLAGSPAIDKGNNTAQDSNGNPINTDQRGLPRVVDWSTAPNGSGDISDIGAYEAQIGAPNYILITQQPADTTAGNPLSVAMQIVDASDNLTGSNANVTIALGANPGNSTLSGTLTVAAVNGAATFSGISLEKAGTGYTLVVGSVGLTGATSNAFDITAGAPGKLLLVQQPTDTLAGQPITPAVTVQLTDSYDNPVAGSNVDISIATNSAGATLSGTTSSTTDANGVATFGDLSINKAADGYTLKASKGNLTATSNTFNIIPTCYDSRIVTNTADSGAGSLRQGMKDVCDGGTITFNIPTSDAGYNATTKRHTIMLTSGQLAIDKGMTINGAGANSIVIDGNRRDRVFNIDGNLTVTLSGLEIRNGSNQNGGGISNRGTLTLNHCMLSGNSARSGGGIDNSGTLTLNVCTLSGNSAGSGGGILSRGTLTLNHCTLSGNSATSDWGGGIYNIGKLTLNASTLSTNSAHRGGGVYNNSDFAESSLTVINSTLNGNSASDLGGGIYNNVRSGDAIAYVINSTFNNNSAGSEGGGIYNIAFTIATKITVINCTFNGNSAVDGGGIYNRAGSVSAQVKIGNTILRAGSKGRNLYNYSGTITSNGYNLSTDFAEGYLNNTGDRVNTDPKLDPAGLKDNGGPTVTIRPLFGSPAIDAGKNMATDANGNAITTDQRGSARPVDFTGIANAEGGDGSDIGAFEAQIGTTPNRLEFVQLSTKSEVNSVITPPVRVVIFDAESNQTASNATITIALAASGNSGALQGTTTVTAVDGVATFPDLFIDKPGTGYALVASSANLTGATSNAFDVVPGPVSKVTFVQQPTDTVAGQPITPAVKVQVLDAFDNPISNAFVQLNGLINGVSGGSASTSTDTLGIATYGNFVLNKPGTYKLLAYNGSVGAVSSVFNVRQSCTNPEVISTADSGPGSLRQAITDTCEGSTITFNIPTTDPGYDVMTKRHIFTLTGGELAINKDLRIDGIGGNSVVISGNNQSRVFNIARSQTVSITGLTISNGNATNSGSNTNGGAIFNSGALTLINSTLNSNSAELGGGIYNNGVSGGASVAIINCTLSDNSATSSGGGVNNTVSSFGNGKVTVANSTLSGNSAPQGGGIYNRVVTRGSAIVTLSNTILRTGSSGENIVNVPGQIFSTYVITSNGYNLSNDNGGGFLTGTGDQVSTDPGFEMDSSILAKPLMRDNGGPVFTIRLLPNSPAINKGSNGLAVDQNNNTLATDARGFTRIVNSTVDIGALEVNYRLSAMGGTPQSTPVNTAFGTPLQATFTEYNRAVNNASVTFTAPTNGATGTFANSNSASVTVSTDANGIATAPAFTANSITGDFAVTASVTGIAGTVNYALTNRSSSQSITFPSPGNRTFGDAPIALTASSSSGLPVSYTIISGPASVNGNMLTITGAGTVTVRASQAGNASFDPAQNVDQTFTVNKAIGTLALSNLSQIYDGSAKAVIVTTTPWNLSGVTITYGHNGNVVQSPTNVGSYAVTASLNNNNYQAADATGTLVISKADQSISFAALATRTYDDKPFSISATASSGLPVSFSIVSGPASISGNTVTIAAAGTITIRASQAGDTNYKPAQSVDQTISVDKAAASITLSNLSQTYDGHAKAVIVTTNPTNLSGVTITYSQNGTSVQSPATAGSYNVTASLSNNNYQANDAMGTLVIAKADQTIAFAPLPSKSYGDAPFSISATASTNLPVDFSIVSGPASIGGNTVTITGAGTVTIRASQAGDANYNPAQNVDQTFTVNKAAATLTLSNLGQTYDGTAKAALATTNPSNLIGVTIAYSQNGSVVQSATNAGSYLVTASLSNNNYQSNDVTGTLVIAKADQSISFASLPNKAYGDAPFNISATASSGLPVSFSIVSGPASISGNNVTITGAGTVTVRASQAGDNNYNAAASVDRSFTVSQITTTTTVTSTLNPAGYGDAVTFNSSVTSSASGKPTGTMQFKDNGGNIGGPIPLNSNGIASVTVSTLSPGTHTITAVYSGDQNFGASTGTLTNGQTINAQIGLSISDASANEGNSGTTNAVFNVTLSPVSSQTITVNYQTADGTAKVSENDYQAITGTVTFAPGETTKSITVPINGDTAYEPDETFFVNLGNPVNASVARAQGVGTIINDDPQSGTIQFAASTYSVNEGDGQLVVVVTRTGDVSGGVNVDYVTSDTTATDRSDFNTAVGTLVFKVGESSKKINLLINEDSYLEGPEVFSLRLSNPTNGGVIGTPEITNITIVDNDTQPPMANIIDDAQNFVRQQYHDFLDREPDAEGLAYWTNEITRCGNGQECIKDRRIVVSAAFYLEQEFQQTGFYAYRLFVATFGRAPSYLEFMNALSQVQKGAQPQENKEAMLKALVESEPVKQLYSTMSNGQYLDATLANTHLQFSDAERTATINALDAGTQTRQNVLAQIVRTPAFVDSQYNQAFVLMQYFGYLRRDPDPQGYQFWLDVLNNRVPNNYRAMVCAFITSTEYQERFSSVITRSNKDCGGGQ